MKRYLCIACLLLLPLLGACAATTPNLTYTAGARVETLSAPVSLSVSNGDQGMGASGYLLYKRPNRMRMVILSPFGTTIMEVFVTGDRITIVDIANSAAYNGLIADLPEDGEGRTWRNARWAMEIDVPDGGPRSGTLERVTRDGARETLTFENGLLTSRRLASGDEVTYGDYSVVNGVPLASEIIMYPSSGGRVRIKVSEPEVNAGLEPESFTPNLDGLAVYPLTALRKK